MSRLARENVLGALPAPVRPLVEGACSEADARGATVYLVGGPVRDLLLDRAVLDVDLMVAGGDDAGAEAIGRAVAQAAGLEAVAHDRFGTLSVRAEPLGVDFATLRREVYARPGALPEVGPGTLEEDLHRRDFSVNAMAIRLSGVGDGGEMELIDLEDGRADLAARTLRVLHDRSFHDDPTRALRAARLAARLGFRLSRGSRGLLRDALRDGVFGAVSGDRLRREIEKLFEDGFYFSFEQAAFVELVAPGFWKGGGEVLADVEAVEQGAAELGEMKVVLDSYPFGSVDHGVGEGVGRPARG